MLSLASGQAMRRREFIVLVRRVSWLPTLVADLIQRKVAVIVTGATPVTRAYPDAWRKEPFLLQFRIWARRRHDRLRVRWGRRLAHAAEWGRAGKQEDKPGES